MSVLEYVYQIFLMLGGLAVFMFGMKNMGDNLERVAGSKMRGMLSKVSNNRLVGVGIGTGVTMLIQSSSATTVMLVGFVNVGIISLFQATSIIMGANIGTTITAQIASLSAYKDILNITAIFSLAAIIGIFMNMFSGSDKIRRVGVILAGLGMLFVGLDIMSVSMEVFRKAPAFVNVVHSISNPFLMLLIGTIFTAIIQSSSAATGILIPMVSSGVMEISPALFFILGTNIGTCITALFASFGANVNGKRTAFVHFLFNVIGAVIFMIFLIPFPTPIINFLSLISGSEPSRQLANFHTVFNVIVALILLPFVKYIVMLAEKIIKDKKPKKEKVFEFIDDLILETPPIAVAQTVKEVIHMNDMAKANLLRSVDCMFNFTIEKKDEVQKFENTIDYLNRELTAYLVKITSLDISEKDEKLIGSLYHVISDIERIGDYATNIAEYGEKMFQEGISFSDDAKVDIENMVEKVMLLYRDVLYTFEKRDTKMLPEVGRREQEIDDLKREMSESHIVRLNKGQCSAESGALYISLASNLERVADHLTNIAYSIKNYTGAMVNI